MKTKLKKLLPYLLLFFVFLFISSCETNEDYIMKDLQNKFSIKTISREEANKLPSFVNAKEVVDKVIKSKKENNNSLSREIFGFEVDDALIKEITSNGYASYNLLIKRI